MRKRRSVLVYKGFWVKPERKRQFDIPKCKCEVNINMDLQEVGCAYVLIGLA